MPPARLCRSSLLGLLLGSAPALATPEDPVLLAPEPDAVVGPSVALEALVTDSAGMPLNARFHVRPVLEGLEPFRIAVLPDSQFYTEAELVEEHGSIFAMQVDWILDEALASNTVFVTHLGDVVQDLDAEDQWRVADAAMAPLDTALPYGIAWGNHDIPGDPADPAWDELLLDVYFPIARFEGQPWWMGGWPEDTTWNSWQAVTAGGLELLFVHLAYEPQAEVLEQAAAVIAAHPDHLVIITTHSFLLASGERIDHGSFDAQDLWDTLVEPFDNVRMVLNGHTPGEATRSDLVAGQPVHQLLSCYHGDGNYGSGYLRVMDFDPQAGTISVSTYSPWLDRWQEDEDSRFELPLPLAPLAWWETVEGVPSGSTSATTWSDAAEGTWEWWVEVEDAEGQGARSATESFRVDATPPALSGVELTVLDHAGVRLSWSSDEPADSRVELGSDGAYDPPVIDDGLVTAHSVEIAQLEPGAAYQARVSSHDAVGNPSEPWIVDFTLDGPQDSAPDTGLSGSDPTCGCRANRSQAGVAALLLGLVFTLARGRTREGPVPTGAGWRVYGA